MDEVDSSLLDYVQNPRARCKRTQSHAHTCARKHARTLQVRRVAKARFTLGASHVFLSVDWCCFAKSAQDTYTYWGLKRLTHQA